MKEFIEKLIGRLEEKAKHDEQRAIKTDETECISAITALQAMADRYRDAIEIVNQLAEEYNNDFCEWKQEDEEGFSNCRFNYQEIISDEVSGFVYCPYCGKKIKVVE